MMQVMMMALQQNNEILRRMQLQIKVDGEEEAEQEMRTVYKEQKKALNEVSKFISALFAAYTINGLVSLKKSEKNKVIKDSEKTLIDLGKKLGNHEIKTIGEILKNQYKNSYYTNAFVFELGGLKPNFKIQRDEFINAIVNKKFHGDSFSDKIWTNKAKMIDKLQSEILNNLRGQTHIDQAIRNIQKEFNVSAFQSKRLFVTELARVQSEGHDEIARSAGIKRQLFDVTLDHKTSELCRGYDGTEWDINDPLKPIPPLHVFCRSALIDLTDSWQFTTKRDNETKELIPYKKYNEWLDDKGVAY